MKTVQNTSPAAKRGGLTVVDLMPPAWLLLGTAVLFLIFAATLGEEALDNAPEDPDYGSTGFWSDTFDLLTFGAFDETVDLPPIVSLLGFLVITLPWLLVAANLLIVALDAIIPF